MKKNEELLGLQDAKAVEGIVTIMKEFADAQERGDITAVVDEQKCVQVENAYATIKALVMEEDPEATVEFRMDEATKTYAVITVTAESIAMFNMAAFADVIKSAANFELYAVKNGKVRLDIVYTGIMRFE